MSRQIGSDIQAPAVSSSQAGTPEADRQEITRLAREFEAMLMTQMLREMRRSMLDEEPKEEGWGGSALRDTADIELGKALSRTGGFGLTDALLETFEHQLSSVSAEPSTASVARGDRTGN